MTSATGLHHVTAVASDAQRNLFFYARVLGMRLVAATVNFNDTTAYHLYYGNPSGAPGSLLTFFAWPSVPAGRQGAGQAAEVSLTVPQESLGFWIQRFIEFGVEFRGPTTSVFDGDEREITFRDPDGMMLRLSAYPHMDFPDRASQAAAGAVSADASAAAIDRATDAAAASVDPDRPASQRFDVPAEFAVQSLRGVTLWVDSSDDTIAVLREVFGYGITEVHGNVMRAQAMAPIPASWVDVRAVGGFLKASEGSGTVDHIAFRVKGIQELSAVREKLRKRGLAPTPVIDRHYFSSVYVREPGGVLVEAATEGPGFTGTVFAHNELLQVWLPPWLESQREQIEGQLPPLYFP